MLKDIWHVLTTPKCWFQNHPYNKIWDEKLRELMINHKFVSISEYLCSLGGIEIWTGNHPYASMRPYCCNIRPKRITILKAYDKYLLDFLESQEEKKDD